MSEGINRESLRKTIEFFEGKPVNANVLIEYANKHGYQPITPSQYEDYLFQKQHDERKQRVFTRVLAAFQGLKAIPELGSKAERDACFKANEEAEYAFIQALHDEGVLSREYDLIVDAIKRIFDEVTNGVKLRTQNMMASAFKVAAEEVIGAKDFTLKQLSDYYEGLPKQEEKAEAEAVAAEAAEAAPVQEAEASDTPAA